jgi:hypothetical protein
VRRPQVWVGIDVEPASEGHNDIRPGSSQSPRLPSTPRAPDPPRETPAPTRRHPPPMVQGRHPLHRRHPPTLNSSCMIVSCLDRRVAAVDRYEGSGHVRRSIGAQEHGDRSDLVRIR